jgi:hypothetical protein
MAAVRDVVSLLEKTIDPTNPVIRILVPKAVRRVWIDMQLRVSDVRLQGAAVGNRVEGIG